MMQKPNISNCIKICSLHIIHYSFGIVIAKSQLTTRFPFVWQESSEIHQGNHIGSIWIMADVCMHGCLFVHCPSCWNGYGKRNRTSSLLNELFLVVTVIIFESNILLSKDCRSFLFQYVLSNFPVLNLYYVTLFESKAINICI